MAWYLCTYEGAGGESEILYESEHEAGSYRNDGDALLAILARRGVADYLSTVIIATEEYDGADGEGAGGGVGKARRPARAGRA